MPRTPGMEALRDLGTAAIPVRTLLLTAAIERSQVLEALQLGARGVVMKESATQLLIRGIRAVMDGQYWVGHDSVSDLVKTLRDLAPGPSENARKKKFG